MDTEKRQQHYVPKFYLRNFSVRGDGKNLVLFQPQKLLFVPSAPLKSQCCRPFFYGRDGQIEDDLSHIEGEATTLLRTICELSDLPPRQSQDWFKLLHFLLLMCSRNPVPAEQHVISNAQLYQVLNELSQGAIAPDPTITPEEALRMALKQVEMDVLFCKDLWMKLIVNNTKIPFITSDYPVVRYNQYLEGRKWPSAHTGLGLVGLQFFWPLNPRLQLVVYDGLTYKVGSKREVAVSLSRSEDVNQLNLLQMLNCDRVVYGNELAEKRYFNQLAAQAAIYSETNRPKTEVVPLTLIIDGERRQQEAIRQMAPSWKINMDLSVINLTKRSKHAVFTNKLSQLRPAILPIIKQNGLDTINGYKFHIPSPDGDSPY